MSGTSVSQADPSDAVFHEGSFRWPAGRPPWISDKACSFYNTSECLEPACEYNHQPDHRSLRLVRDGPNICKDHLIGEHGCEFSKKGEGKRCHYSHDLTKAALPLHDRAALKEHLLSAEVYFNDGCPSYDDEMAKQKADKLLEEGSITGGMFVEKVVELAQARQAAVNRWHDGQEQAAKSVLEQFQKTRNIARDDQEQINTPAFDVNGMSGADILRECGVKKPFGMQRKRKALVADGSTFLEEYVGMAGSDGWETEEEWAEQGGVKVPQEKKKKKKGRKGRKQDISYGDDESDDMDPFSEANILELGCQGINPWDPEAYRALEVLRGDFE
ncbi:MAG: hypothetical protein Q9174_006761 [Haloplaca sp. 1 TL-2023]